MCLAIPGRLLNIECDNSLTREGRTLIFCGIVKKANLAYVPEVRIGDYVLVHAGFAIAIIDEAVAQETLAYLAEVEPEELS